MTSRFPDIPGYDIEAQIGRGGMGVVYRGRRRADGAVFALKMILHGRGASFATLARFRVEAEALACLNHPSIIKIRDVGVHDGCPYFAMDFAPRGTLKDAIASGPQPPMMSAGLVRTLALAVQHAHDRGLLHRDLKPANVLLAADGTPVVSDFGIVKFARPMRDVRNEMATFCVSELDTYLEEARFADEAAAQYRPPPAPADDDDDITRDVWEQCATRTGVLDDETRLRPVREFLTAARPPAGGGETADPYKSLLQAGEETHQRMSEWMRRRNPSPPDYDRLTRDQGLLGSPNYMAPEQAAGEVARIGRRTDVYALGGILYEMFTGRPPFLAASLFDLLSRVRFAAPPPPRRFVPELSADLEAVCLKCLEKSPDDRYQTADDLAEDLARVIGGYAPRGVNAGRTVEPPPAAATEPPPVKRRGWWPFG